MLGWLVDWLLKASRKRAVGDGLPAASKEAANRLIAEGNHAENAGKLQDACAKYREAVNIAPSYAPAHLNLGIGLEAIGDANGAMRSYEAVLAADPGDVYASYNLGKLLSTRGAFEQAEQLLRSALDRKPEFPEASVALSNVYDSQGKPDAAIAALEAALRQRPEYVGALYNYGAILKSLGRLPEAERVLRRALALEPGNIDALRVLGGVFVAQGNVEEAISYHEKVRELAPDNAVAHFDLGNVLVQQGRLDEATVCYRKALALEPEFPEAYSNLGNALRDRGRLDEAILCYQRSLELRPDFSEAHSNLGNALRDLDRLEEAVVCYRRALELKPLFPEAHSNLGHALFDQGQRDEAVACYRKALALDPDHAAAHAGLGNALKEEGRLDEAMACYRKALTLNPDVAETHYNLGNALGEQGQQVDALDHYRTALSLAPEYAQAHWSLAMSQIPIIYEEDTAPARCRAAFSLELDRLDRWFNGTRMASGVKAVGVQTPFYLAYHEESNRDLLRRYGRLCARIMDEGSGREGRAPSRSLDPNGAIRVGVVSRHFRNHSVWNAIVKGWFQEFDRKHFALEGFYLGVEEDQETLFAKANASHFEQGKKGLRQWIEIIAGRRADVLIYPEIGMDPMTVKLASLRLAPIQAAAWGHPETTGLPTIDYYLSAEGLEPANAQENYTERLVMLPHLGCFYQPPQLVPACPDLRELGIDPNSPLLLCPGVPFKYAPRDDWVLAEIARRLGRCRFVFFTHQTRSLSEKLQRRLETAFARNHMAIGDFVTFIPWQSRAAFYGLLERADVVLDSIGFSGFNTAMQAVDCCAPFVSREGRFLRGRLASGILKQLGLQELVAGSEEDYIALAVRLAQDVGYRARVRERLAAGRVRLCGDVAPIRALEAFLVDAIRRIGTDRASGG